MQIIQELRLFIYIFWLQEDLLLLSEDLPFDLGKLYSGNLTNFVGGQNQL